MSYRDEDDDDIYVAQRAALNAGLAYPPRTHESRSDAPITANGRERVAKALEIVKRSRPAPPAVAVTVPVLPITDDATLDWVAAHPDREQLAWSTAKSLAYLATFGRTR